MPISRRPVTWMAVGLTVVAAACGNKDAPPAPSTSSSPASSSVVGTTVTMTTTAAPAQYEATLVPVQENRGSTSINVQRPQVTGGSVAVRDRFNTGMRTALDEVVGPDSDTTVEDGSLAGDERSRVTTITPHVVAGVAVFNWYAAGAAHPNNSVATIAINADTAQPILLKDVFVDQQAAAERLTTLVTQDNPDVAPLTPATIDNFLNWVPTADGFHAYVPVVHAMGDYFPATVPWDQIADLMTPGMRTALIP